MKASIVITKGQIVNPSKVRQGDEIIIRPVTDAYIDGLKGSLPTRGKALQALRADKREERER
jgi:hypothetical protein